MVDVIRVSRDDTPTPEARREWLVTNGLGGFASATISGEITRRYHGFLIAALPAPQGRVVMLNDLDVAVGRSDGSLASLRDSGRFVDFTLTMGLPSWRYEIDGMTIEKSVLMPARHNITYIGFRLIGGARAIRLFLRPAVNFRRIEAAVSEPLALGYALTADGQHYEIAAGSGLPVLRLMISGCDATSFTADGGSRHECDFMTEYHWFTDWGRDAMISLEGLTLATGRVAEGKWILRAFAHYVRDGLIPNMFPEGDCEGLYHTADATLWFFHALARYVEYTGDRATLTLILPKLQEIVRLHLEGTRFGIKADPRDGLLSQGAEGYQLTWMDAKVGDWVVTPRRGKAVEINALWYNALCLLAEWLKQAGNAEADAIAKHAATARQSFNRRFWHDDGGYLYDVVDSENGDDVSFRPNQIF